jgi:hypothetical protein
LIRRLVQAGPTVLGSWSLTCEQLMSRPAPTVGEHGCCRTTFLRRPKKR